MTRFSLTLVLAALATISTPVFAQQQVDPNFGTKYFNNGHGGYVQDILIQPDRKIVMVSNCAHFEDMNFPFCMLRLTPEGGYDTSFVGSGNRIPGVVRTRVPGATIIGETHGVAVQADGKLVLVGWVVQSGSTEVLAMVRYHPNGDVDTSFGSAGFVVTDVTAGLNDRGREIVIQPDGKIVVVGYSSNDTNYQQFVARYTSGGIPDTTFGSGGFFRADLPGNITSGHTIALQSDGKIVAGGNSSGTFTGYLLTRLNSDGSPDNSWDGDGYRIVPHTLGDMHPLSENGIRSLVIQSNGKVTALGSGNVIFRFNSNGSLDQTFNGSGSRTAFPTSLFQRGPYDLIITAGGRITVVGESRLTPATAYTFQVARYLSDGSPETAFSDDGFLTIDIGNANDGGRAVAADADGRIVVGGISGQQSCDQCYPYLFSFMSATRLLVPLVSISISGRVTRPDGRPVTNAFLTTQDSTGVTRTALTNPFGYYRFPNLQPGHAYSISVRAKGRTFADRVVAAADDIVNLDFVSESK